MAIIEVNKLRKRYGERIVVADVSFAVEPGEIFGIIGPNGAGKTTTVECVSGLRRPDGGSVAVDGLDPQRSRTEVRERLGVQLQSSELPDKLKVHEALDLYGSFYPDPADPAELMRELGLTDHARTAYSNCPAG
jgi:ABC-2 type transport system ATP-binding protein